MISILTEPESPVSGERQFDPQEAFARNLGWVTPAEAQRLRGCRVAIAGMGGVGGSHLMTLTRLGVGAFHIADFDCFEVANFNRQRGAFLSTLGRPKVEVMAERARDVNPRLDLVSFPDGIDPSNIDAFLEGVDLYVDSLDFFAVAARRMVFDRCAAKGIPAITAAPLGMGAALLNFLPGKMTFEEYFQLEGQPEAEQLLRFMVGLSPAAVHRPYLVDPAQVDLAQHKGPSTPMAIEICAGVAVTTALKILLGRGKVLAAPYGLHFDAYRNKLVKTWRPGGNRHPLQRLVLAVARRQFSRKIEQARQGREAAQLSEASRLEQVLDLARWAPSGDNTQPWRFEIVGERQVVVHGHDTRDHCVYDLEGRASQIALGALLETLAIGASRFGWRMSARRREGLDTQPTFDVHFQDAGLAPDPLLELVPKRVTQRRAMKTTPLTPAQRQALEAAAGPDHQVVWLDGPGWRRQMARMLFRSAHIRLTIEEAYQVHARIIAWGCRYSDDCVPDQAVGLDPLALRLMRWAMGSWERVRFLNRYTAGTVLPRVQLDLLPALRCGAHFLLTARKAPATVDDHVQAGRAVQRFWLTAAQLGLQFQPEMTPLIFSGYARRDIAFTGSARARREAADLNRRLETMFGADTLRRGVFLGRVGQGPAPRARSLRRPLADLMAWDGEPALAAGPSSPSFSPAGCPGHPAQGADRPDHD